MLISNHDATHSGVFRGLCGFELRLIVAAAVGLLFSKAYVGFQADVLMPDDLLRMPLRFGFDLNLPESLARGRILLPVLAELFVHLGLNAPRVHVAGALIMAVSHLASTLLLCRIWGLERDRVVAVVVVVMVVLHPYFVDFYIWRIWAPFIGISMLLAMLGIAAVGHVRGGAALGVVLIVVSLCVFHVGVAFALVATLAGFAVDQALGWRHGGSSASGLHFRRLAVIATAAVVYLGGMMALDLWFMSGSSSGFSALASTDIAVMAARFQTLAWRLATDDLLVSSLVRVILAGIGLIGSIGLAAMLVRRGGFRALVAIIALCAAFPAALVVAVLASSFTYRDLGALSVAWAGAVAVTLILSPEMPRRVFLGLLGLCALGMLGQSVEAIADVQRMIRRESAFLNRVLARIETLDEQGQVRMVATVGVNAGPIWQLRTAVDASRDQRAAPAGAQGLVLGVGYSTIGLDFASGYVTALINEFLGRSLAGRLSAEQEAAAAAYCRTVSPWPAQGSVGVRGPLAIICLNADPSIWRWPGGRS